MRLRVMQDSHRGDGALHDPFLNLIAWSPCTLISLIIVHSATTDPLVVTHMRVWSISGIVWGLLITLVKCHLHGRSSNNRSGGGISGHQEENLELPNWRPDLDADDGSTRTRKSLRGLGVKELDRAVWLFLLLLWCWALPPLIRVALHPTREPVWSSGEM